MDKDIPYYLGFSFAPGIGPMKFSVLKKRFGDVRTAYKADGGKIREMIGSSFTDAFLKHRMKFDPWKKAQELREAGIQVLTQEDHGYPKQFLEISDPPVCLYCKGRLDGFNFSGDLFFSVVGTRKPTAYGEIVAQKFSFELAQSGFIVVSGMAIGIDTVAHVAALAAHQKTIAILGCGVDIIYPYSNRYLYHQIIEKGGLVISEFPPGHTVLPGLFVARNRLISGLSKGVLVVEGASDSGAMITARYAAEQGKDVFAPPGPLTSPMSAAPNMLLKNGAKLVTSVSDILEEFDMAFTPSKKDRITKQLTEEELIIFEAIAEEPKKTDDLVKTVKLPVPSILRVLSVLEIKGLVEKNREAAYQITASIF